MIYVDCVAKVLVTCNSFFLFIHAHYKLTSFTFSLPFKTDKYLNI